MVDALDSKSSDRKIVWVRVPPPVLSSFDALFRCLSRYRGFEGGCAFLHEALRHAILRLRKPTERENP